MHDYTDFTLGLYEKGLPAELGWPERLETAKKAGFDFIEISIDESDERLARLDWSLREKSAFMKAKADSGVFVPTMCLSGHQRFPIGSRYEEIRKRGMDIMEKAIRFASDTGIRIVQLAGYDSWYGEPGTAETVRRFKENLAISLERASRLGVTLALETMGTPFLDSLEEIMGLVRHHDSPYLQAYPDIGNLTARNKNVRHEFGLAKGHIVAVHVKDTRKGEIRRVPFGRGTVDFADAFKAIKDSGFFGPLLIEMWADPRFDNQAEIEKARKFVLDKMRQAWESG
ncbi:MAG: L-ribulose-5-phosphate 3-epimerase [Spirochaetales bacterium]|nr:MAG: L-ribulose-5-phosphate 3-epimerase [Spirochaetales bacterium]